MLAHAEFAAAADAQHPAKHPEPVNAALKPGPAAGTDQAKRVITPNSALVLIGLVGVTAIAVATFSEDDKTTVATTATH